MKKKIIINILVPLLIKITDQSFSLYNFFLIHTTMSATQVQKNANMWTTPASSNPLESEECPQPNPTFAIGALGGAEFNWQSAATCNITNLNITCQGLISTTVLNKNTSTDNNFIYLNFNCDGDDPDENCDTLNITGNTFTQTNYVNLSSVQQVYVSNESQQNMNVVLSQASKAVAKGISIFPQSTSATNIVNAFLTMQMAIVTDIENICASDETNVITVDANGYNTVNFTNNVIDQTNVVNSTCTQKAIVTSKMSQSISTSISQYASALSAGLTFFALMMIGVIMMIIFMIFLYLELDLVLVFLAIFMICGGIVLLVLGLIDKSYSSWYGFSPGVPASSDASKFTVVSGKENVQYSDADAAKAEFDAGYDKYDAMDYVVDEVGNKSSTSGKATFYKLNTNDNINELLEDIINYNKDGQNSTITFRAPVFQNYKENAPNIQYESDGVTLKSGEFYPDVYLNSKTGDLRYLLPKLKNASDPTQGLDGGKVAYQGPSTLNARSLDNVFAGLTNITGDPQAFFWVEPKITSIEVPDMSQSSVDAEQNEAITLVKMDTPFPPAGNIASDANNYDGDGKGTKFDKSTVVADAQADANYPISGYAADKINVPLSGPGNVSKDYLLVLFPYGPSSENPDSSDPTTFERYDTSPTYNLYPAYYTSSQNWIPYVKDFLSPVGSNLQNMYGDGKQYALSAADKAALDASEYTWLNPASKVVGYNLIAQFASSRSTLIKYTQNTPWEWMLGAGLIGGGTLMFVGFLYLRNKKSNKNTTLTISQNGPTTTSEKA